MNPVPTRSSRPTRTGRVELRVSAEELAAIDAASRSEGVERASWVRRVALEAASRLVAPTPGGES